MAKVGAKLSVEEYLEHVKAEDQLALGYIQQMLDDIMTKHVERNQYGDAVNKWNKLNNEIKEIREELDKLMKAVQFRQSIVAHYGDKEIPLAYPSMY